MTAFIPPVAPGMLFPPYTADITGSSSSTTPFTAAIAATAALFPGALKLWYRLNDAAGSSVIADSSGNGLDATENSPGSTQYQQPGLITELGQYSQAADAIGTSQFQRALTGLTVNGKFTLEWWLKPAFLDSLFNSLALRNSTGISEPGVILEGNNTLGRMRLFVEDVGGVSTSNSFLQVGVTGHYALRYDGSVVTIYKNGVLAATSAAVTFHTAFNMFWYNQLTVSTGSVDEIVFWTDDIGAAQLLAHYNAGVAAIITTTIPGVVGTERNNSRIGGLAAAPTAPPLRPQTPLSTVLETWPNGPPAAATRPAATVNPYTTQDQTNTFFRIVSPRPGSGT